VNEERDPKGYIKDPQKAADRLAFLHKTRLNREKSRLNRLSAELISVQDPC
jgi:hypothetical protein